MDKKVVILVVLLGILVIFWIPIMTKLGLIKPPEQQPQKIEQTTSQPERQPISTGDVTTQPTATVSEEATTSLSRVLENQADDSEATPPPPEDSVIVETNLMRVVLSNIGGAPRSIKLKKYFYNDGTEIEMLPDNELSTPAFIFDNGSVNINNYYFESVQMGGKYSIGSGSQEIVFSYSLEDGSNLSKTYRFYADRYDYDLILDINNRNAFGFERNYLLEWGNKLAPTELNIEDDYNSMWALALMAEREKFDDYDNNMFNITRTGDTRWVASRSKYFTAIMMPRSRMGIGVAASGVKKAVTINNKSVTSRELAIGIQMDLPYETSVVDSFSVFVGPMDYDALKKFNNDVVDIVDIGTTAYVGWIIKIFAIPILWLLPRMYEIIPNYGLVIIIFSLLVKLITWPLSKKTVQSMAAMKDIQPEMAKLKEKHKNNPQALNKEMMKLYKERGINPLSGCLPYLPQMPLFFALFSVFRQTILLRQAPFILWWNDLSRGALSVTDPYIILVVLMCVLMFVQQKMIMTDQKNKAMIYMMPLIMGFFFYRASAGLVLYWTCFSLFSYIEQLVFRKPKPQTAVVK